MGRGAARRIAFTGGAAAVMLVALSACSALSPEEWHLQPIEFDDSTNRDELIVDVTSPVTHGSDDTEGGFWTEANGSWLHLDAEGETVYRHNTPRDETAIQREWTIRGISAASPSILAVSKTDGLDDSDWANGLFWYDTATVQYIKVHPDVTTAGDVDIDAEGRIVFVDFLGESVPDTYNPEAFAAAPQPYAIRAISSDGVLTTLIEADPAVTVTSADLVDVDTDDTGAVYVATETETWRLDPDGVRETLSTYTAQVPQLAVNRSGDVLMLGADVSADASAMQKAEGRSVREWQEHGWSREAVAILDDRPDCSAGQVAPPGETALSYLRSGQSPDAAQVLTFSCGDAPIAFEDHSFVLAIGDEAGTVLTRVTPPRN